MGHNSTILFSDVSYSSKRATDKPVGVSLPWSTVAGTNDAGALGVIFSENHAYILETISERLFISLCIWLVWELKGLVGRGKGGPGRMVDLEEIAYL